MATFRRMAKEAGLNPVICTHCGRKVRTDALISNLWAKITERLKAGETVYMKGFGSFAARLMRPRKFTKPQAEFSGVEGFGARYVLRFTQSAAMRAKLNDGENDG